MVADFIEYYAKLIASTPESIKVSQESINNNLKQIIIYASSDDTGKIIGKNGNMIDAIKTIVNGCKVKDGISYKIRVVSI